MHRLCMYRLSLHARAQIPRPNTPLVQDLVAQAVFASSASFPVTLTIRLIAQRGPATVQAFGVRRSTLLS